MRNVESAFIVWRFIQMCNEAVSEPKDSPPENEGKLWDFFEKSNKIFIFSSFIVASFVFLLSFVYCHENNIDTLLPLVLSKVAISSFVFFGMTLTVILFLPWYFGFSEGTRTRKNLRAKEIPSDIKFFKFLLPYPIIFISLYILGCLVLTLWMAFFPRKFHYPILFILTPLFLLLPVTMAFYKKLPVTKDKSAQHFIPSLLWVEIAILVTPCLNIILGTSFISAQSFSMSTSKTMMIVSMLALGFFVFVVPFITILFSFYRGLFEIKKSEIGVIGYVVICVLVLVLLFVFPVPFSKWYFRQMHYGNFSVRIAFLKNRSTVTCSPWPIGRVIFNSGSELYVKLNPKLKENSSVVLFVKRSLPNTSNSSAIIRIPYKNLKEIPEF